MSTSTSSPGNAPTIFNNPDLFDGDIRVIMKDGDPWFVAKDVCDALGLNTSNLAKVLDSYERGSCSVQYTGQTRNVAIISESGLYSLILRSRKPAAKAFKKWVTSVVLPALRKDGMYVMGEEKAVTGELEETQFILKAMTLLHGKVERLSSENAKLFETNRKLVNHICEQDAVITENLRSLTTDEWRALNHLYLKHGDKVRLGQRAAMLHRELLGSEPTKQCRVIQTAKGDRETFPNVYPVNILNRAAQALGFPVNMEVV